MFPIVQEDIVPLVPLLPLRFLYCLGKQYWHLHVTVVELFQRQIYVPSSAVELKRHYETLHHVHLQESLQPQGLLVAEMAAISWWRQVSDFVSVALCACVKVKRGSRELMTWIEGHQKWRAQARCDAFVGIVDRHIPLACEATMVSETGSFCSTKHHCTKNRRFIHLIVTIWSLSVLQVSLSFSCCLAPKHRGSGSLLHRLPTLLRQSSERESNVDETINDPAMFYSPNVALDESRYRYDLDDETTTAKLPALNASSSVNEYSFFDEAVIYVRAGSGGQGASTYKKGAGGQDGPPDGGNGGKGGNVLLVVDESLNTLAGLTHAWRPNAFGGSGASYKTVNEGTIRPKSFRAENGADGARQFKNGRYGQDVVIRVPPGTVVQEEIDVQYENGESTVHLADLGGLTLDERTLVVAHGGDGGEGTGVLGKVSGRGVRRPRVPPQGGEKKRLKLTLKIVADVALVAVPNAGKSTFLAAVTRAKPKIANVRKSLFLVCGVCCWFTIQLT